MSELNFEDQILKITLGDLVRQFTEEDLQRQMPVFMQDVDADTRALVETYQSLLSAGSFPEAELYRAEHPELETRIWDACKANSMLAYSAYTYLYAKGQRQQCVISAVQPPEGSEDGSVLGQKEGDIWFRIDETRDGVLSTTPFQKQEDGSYLEFAVAPKLVFAAEEDIDALFAEGELPSDN